MDKNAYVKTVSCNKCGNPLEIAVENEKLKLGQRVVKCDKCGAFLGTKYKEWLELEPYDRQKLLKGHAEIKSFIITALLSSILSAFHVIVGILWLILGNVLLYFLFYHLNANKFKSIIRASLKRTSDKEYRNTLLKAHGLFPLTQKEKNYYKEQEYIETETETEEREKDEKASEE